MSDRQRGDERRETADRDPVSHKYTPKTVPHTPTPWMVQGGDPITEQVTIRSRPALPHHLQQHVADCGAPGNPLAEANAAHIVLCVNSHDRLLSVVRQMVELWDNDGDHGFPLYDETKAALAALQPPPDHE